jgi:hypothetical protein
MYSLASLAITIAVYAVLVSILYPAFNQILAALGVYGSRTDHFELELSWGAAVFKGWGGGFMLATITELRPRSGRSLPGGALSRDYLILLFGLGVGGVGAAWDAVWELPLDKDFYTVTLRSLYAFVGIGNITSGGVTPPFPGAPIGGPFVGAAITMILPEGTTPPWRIGAYWGGGNVGGFAFTAMAIWSWR